MERTAMNWKNTTPSTMRKNIMKNAKLLLVLFVGIVAANASAETVTYYATDQLGSPIAAMDSSGSLLWWESYNPYGEKRRSPSSANGDTGYTGHQHDSATGLTYMQARYYDPVIGRFLANDPVGFAGHLNGTQGPQGFNRYAYVNNNPYKYTDPDGEAIGTQIGHFTQPPPVARQLRSHQAEAIVIGKRLDAGRRLTHQAAKIGSDVAAAAQIGCAGKCPAQVQVIIGGSNAILEGTEVLTSDDPVGDGAGAVVGNKVKAGKKTAEALEEIFNPHVNEAIEEVVDRAVKEGVSEAVDCVSESDC